MTHLAKRKLEAQSRACCHCVRDLLCAVLQERRPADRALRYFFRNNRHYGSRDRRLLTASVFAVFRWWGWLREMLPAGTKEADSQDHQTVPINLPESQCQRLLLAAWLLERDELPPVTDVWAGQCGLTADWRRITRHKGNDLGEYGARILAAVAGCHGAGGLAKKDLVPAWCMDYLPPGNDRDRLIDWFQRRPPVWIRVQRADTSNVIDALRNEGIDVEAHPGFDDAFRVKPTRTNLYGLNAFQHGDFEIQDLASQAVGRVCAPSPGERWWDACAGAGGKSLHLARLMNGKGTIVATDIREHKLKDLKRRARRGGVPNIQTREWKGTTVRRKQATFDGVLVDAPCTCSGTWRRNPDARWSTLEKDVRELADLQTRLLHGAASGLKPGGAGTLVYATCSVFRHENGEVVEAFLNDHKDFELMPFTHPITGVMTCGMVQLLPWEGDCDSMFIARLVRKA